jgi:hypothetical protein
LQCASCSEYPRCVLFACFILWLGLFWAESRACCTFLMGFKFSFGARSSSRHIHRFSHGVPDRRGLRRPNIDHRPQTSTTNRIKPACAVAVGQRMGQTKSRRNIIAIFGKHVHTLKNTSRFATFDKRVHTLSTHTIHDLPWCYSRYAIPRLTGTLLGSAKEPLGDLTYSLNC